MEDRRSLPPHEDELSLALLRSAEGDEPSAAAYSKVAAALGVSAVGLGASVPAQAAAVSSAAAGGKLARFTGSLFGKALLVGVSSALLMAGGVALRRHYAAANHVAALSVPPAPLLVVPRAPIAADLASAAPFVEAPAEPELVDAPQSVAALASAEHAPTPTLRTNPSLGVGKALAAKSVAANASAKANAGDSEDEASVARAAKASSLPEQVASLDRARMALGSGDSAAALAEIAHYRSTWPRGVFLTEASVLEIQALAKRGEIVLAGMRAKAFVTAHPDSPQADRLRQLIPPSSR